MSKEQSATSHALTGVLDDIEEYLDQRQDVRDGEDGVQLPNEAMSLLSRLAEARTIWARSALSETARIAEAGTSFPAWSETPLNPQLVKLARDYLALKRYLVSGEEIMAIMREIVRVSDTVPSAIRESVTIPRSLAERSHAMFQSVDPSGGLASEWRDALNLPRYP